MAATVTEFIRDKSFKNDNRIFLHFEGRDISYRELDETTNRVGNGLRSFGLSKGDKVCLMLPNCLEFVFTWLGLVKIGAVEVPINTAHKGDLLAYLINDSDARVMVIDSQYLAVIKKIEPELKNLETLVVWEEQPGTPVSFAGLDQVAFDALYRGGDVLDEAGVTAQDDFCILYTSGTTGPSKGVVLSHQYTMHVCSSNARQLGYTREDILYACLPLFHGNAQLMSVLAAMAADARIILARRFSASKFWDEIITHRVTATNLPGSVISILLKHSSGRNGNEHTLKKVFTAGTPKAAWENFEELTRVKIYEGYGSTECGMVLMNTVDERKVGSIGKPAEGYQVTVFDDDDNELPVGHVGELVVRPEKPFCIMKEYYKMPGKTLEACRNLWFHTGDYGRRDEEGFFYYVDRKKDVIRRRGENISSFEVERSINVHPEVLESAAIALPDPLGEYELKIVVVPRSGANLTLEELIAFCEERMAYFMVPRYVEFRDSLPKTPTDRVEKYKLRQEGITEKTWDRFKSQNK